MACKWYHPAHVQFLAPHHHCCCHLSPAHVGNIEPDAEMMASKSGADHPSSRAVPTGISRIMHAQSRWETLVVTILMPEKAFFLSLFPRESDIWQSALLVT
jgi:hypothetical protein